MLMLSSDFIRVRAFGGRNRFAACRAKKLPDKRGAKRLRFCRAFVSNADSLGDYEGRPTIQAQAGRERRCARRGKVT